MKAFTGNPYKVSPETLPDAVMDEMAEKKYGHVLFDDNKMLISIFTCIDAIETRLRK